MGLFGGGGKSRDELIAEAAELNEEGDKEEKKDDVSTGNEKIDIELTKLSGRLEGLDEVRKASSERFSRISEQVGELRGMIVDTNKAMTKVEVSTTKAVDLVESVHPEKLMIEVRKQDGKVEALRASIESNEAIMKDIMLEMKKMRGKMGLYKGIEQVMQMNDEIKHELSNIKKVEATIERHADKVETIFSEVNKKFSDFDKFNDVVVDLDKSFKKLASDFDKLRTKTETKQDRNEFVDLLDRFNEFEKHTTNLMKLLDERNKTVKDEFQAKFEKLVISYRERLDKMRPPTKPLPPKKEEEEEASGEDNAAADQKRGMFSRFKGVFKKKEPEADDTELFPEEETPEEAPEKPAEKGEAPAEETSEKKEGEPGEKQEEVKEEGSEEKKEESAPVDEKEEPKEVPDGEKPKDKPVKETPKKEPTEEKKD